MLSLLHNFLSYFVITVEPPNKVPWDWPNVVVTTEVRFVEVLSKTFQFYWAERISFVTQGSSLYRGLLCQGPTVMLSEFWNHI